MSRFNLFFGILISSMLLNSSVLAQNQGDFNNIIKKIDAYNKNFPVERLYLSLDKPYYNVGDTIWFKAFLLTDSLTQSLMSEKIYVELYDDSLKLVDRKAYPILNGLGRGQMEVASNLPDGNYILRAYTNWQQNFQDRPFFQRQIYIGNYTDKIMVVSDMAQSISSNQQKLNLSLKITDIKKRPLSYNDFELSINTTADKTYKKKAETNSDGILNISFDGSIETSNALTFLEIKDKKGLFKDVSIPLYGDSSSNLDIQFLPESGYLINNIYTKIGFKVLDVKGLGKNLSGKIVNQNNEAILEVSANHKGIGSFYLLPKPGDRYHFDYVYKGKKFSKLLPIAKEEGTSLRINHLSSKDSVYTYIRATGNRLWSDNYQLLIQKNSHLEVAFKINLLNGYFFIKLAKKDLPDGLIHFTLFSPELKILNERIVIVNPSKKIKIKIDPPIEYKKSADSILVKIKAVDEADKPLIGSFSMAVTDDSQVRQNNFNNIIDYYFLGSELNGNLEGLDWYFKDEEDSTATALDNLLLTQAWVGYNWETALSDNLKPNFKSEKLSIIQGNLTNLFNKPVPGVKVTLLSLGKDILAMDTISNAQGYFTFQDLPVLDTVKYAIKIKNAKGKASSATIKLDEFVPTQKPLLKYPYQLQWYVSTDSILLKHYKNGAIQVENLAKEELKRSGYNLKDVNINAAKPNVARNLGWDANFKLKISEEDLMKMGRKTLLDVLKEKIPGFGVSRHWSPSCSSGSVTFNFENYVVNGALVETVRLDFMNTKDISQNSEDMFFNNQLIFNSLSASDVKEINVYKGCVFYYFDIKTRSGNGFYARRSVGSYVYRPMPLTLAKEFYSPKFTAVKDLSKPDLRSTIYWNSNITTNELGEAEIFFSPNIKSINYTIKVEGADLNGRVGFNSIKFLTGDKSNSTP